MSFKGSWDASGNLYPEGAVSGDFWIINVPGTMGAVFFDVQDILYCTAGVPIPSFAKFDGTDNDLPWRAFAINQQNDPPVTPADGDIYIVGSSPSGNWTGHANEIARQIAGAGWYFETPLTMQFWVLTTPKNVKFWDGALWKNLEDLVTLAGIGAEPAFSKNTAFNKDFGSGTGQVCEGDKPLFADGSRDSSAKQKFNGGVSLPDSQPILFGTAEAMSDYYDPALPGVRRVGAQWFNNPVHHNDSITITDGKTVDGRDISVDGSKLDGIEAGAQVNVPPTTIQDSDIYQSFTAEMTFQQAKRFSPVLEIAKYIIWVSADISNDLEYSSVIARVQLDDSINILSANFTPINVTDFQTITGVYFFNCLSAGAHDIDFDFMSSDGATVYMQEKRIVVMKVVE
jgi:hypothetical protein